MKTSQLRRCIPLLALLLLASCYKATFYQNPNVVAGARHERWSDFFILGLVGSEHFDVRNFCGQDAVAEVRTGGNFGTAFVSVLTIGIYTPHKVYLTCSARPGQVLTSRKQVELLIDSNGRPARATVLHDGHVAHGEIHQISAQAFRVRYEEASL
jgi:hypothetical protein